MKMQLIKVLACCAACAVTTAQAQTSSTERTPGSSSSAIPGQSARSGKHHQDLKASEITGAQIQSSTGNELGTIQDVIINPARGHIDFAVVSLSGGASGSPGALSAPGGTSGSSSSSSGKQVAVPWMLLRPAATTASAGSQPAFTFTGQSSKLESAPSFDAATDLSQGNWRQSVYSYFGVSGRGSLGAAESPSGLGVGGSQDQNPNQGGAADHSQQNQGGASSGSSAPETK